MGTGQMPFFLWTHRPASATSHRRREVWQRRRWVPTGSVTSPAGEQNPQGKCQRGKNHKASAARVRATRWAARQRTRASQAIKRAPVGYTACSPPGWGWCWQYGTRTGEEGRSATRNVGGLSEAAEEEEGKTWEVTDFVSSFPRGTACYFIIYKLYIYIKNIQQSKACSFSLCPHGSAHCKQLPN